MKALGYIRVSTREQGDSGAGLDAQRAAIVAECARRGWPLEFIEDVASGSSLDRPGVTDALERLAAGTADVLVVTKLDRLSCSVLDFTSIMTAAEREDWTVATLDTGLDLTTAVGQLAAGVLVAVAQFAEYEACA